MIKGKLHRIDYVVGKARSKDAAESLRDRINEVLTGANLPQEARITKISNGHGTYGYRVNVTSEVQK